MSAGQSTRIGVKKMITAHNARALADKAVMERILKRVERSIRLRAKQGFKHLEVSVVPPACVLDTLVALGYEVRESRRHPNGVETKGRIVWY